MKSLFKSTFREIKQSFGRYIAILAIVALGVGFFGGLKVTKPAMIKTLNSFLDKENFFDFRLISTIGFEDEDLKALSNIKDLTAIDASWNIDALCNHYRDSGYKNDSESVYRIHSITNGINELLITSGRMPENANECVIDNYMSSVVIGDQIIITDNNEEDTLDMLKNHTLTIVGTVRSPYYINFERGNTSIGNGKVSGFIYVPRDEFECDYISEIYVTVSNGQRYGAYTDEYDDYIESKKTEIEELLEQVVAARYDRIAGDANEKIADGQKELDDKKAEAKAELEEAAQKLKDGADEIEENKKLLIDGEKEIGNALTEISKKGKDLAAAESELENKKSQLMMAKAMLPEAEYSVSLAKIEAGEKSIRDGRAAIENAKITLKEKQNELADGWSEIEKAESELEDGQREYDDAVKEFDEKIADAQAELDDAKKELENIKDPDSYVLDRTTNIGYACYESDTNIVAAVANVFPVFFFLVAVLICMTTMNRMVEEQRTQIGILKALGYSNSSILMKYVFYSGSAALIGAVAGYILGTIFLPQAIWQGYNIMYNMGPTIEYKSVTIIAVLSILAAMLCSVGAAYFSVIYELKDVPANLIRPKAPKNGKRIFLEYITPLWKRMKFLHKVSARNIIRYKKRFFMMVLGIGGCTALVLTGFGIGDSVKGIADLQYENIQIYDMGITFSEDTSFDDIEAIKEDKAIFQEKTMDVSSSDFTKSANVVVPYDFNNLTEFLVLNDARTGSPLEYPDDGQAIVSKSLADKLSVNVGDSITIADSDMNMLKVEVSGICENYVYSYVYLSKETYEKKLGELSYNSAWINVPDNVDKHEKAAEYMNIEGVLNVSVISDLQDRIATMMKGMDFIVLVVILCAGALAFIVLYNLTNINITERIREIATIKVLGFYAGETAQYVLRENLVLTAIGALAGIPLGKALHAFIMYNIRIDMVSFRTYIAPISYVYAILLTFVFSFIVNFFMYFKLQKISMTESLKGVE